MSKENLNSLATRLIALLLLTAFCLSLLYPQKSQAAFHHSSSFNPQTIAPIFSPPESFQVSSSKFQGSSRLAAASIVSTISTSLIDSSLGSFFGLLASSTSESSKSLSSTNPTLLLFPTGSVKFDFDGDGKADIARWQRASTEWKVRNSSNGSLSTNLIGSLASVIAPADYDGDGKTDSAVFNASTGTWTIKRSSNGTTQTITGFGQTGDKPVSGDYDGDGLADAAVWRPSSGTWFVKQSTNGATVSFQFGASGDIPVAGNYDGDARMDYAVFRPSTGYWYVWFSSTNNYSGWQWGFGSDIPVPADYDGDGKTDYAVYRGSAGAWYVLKSSTNNTQFVSQTWGNYGDQPVPADYDGDGKADYAVWRPTTGVWYAVRSSDGGYTPQTLGATGDVAVPSAYLKQIGGEVFGYDLAKERLSPKNATGGTNLYSRNFSWGTGLVSLAGRGGLDVGLGVSYNSLVWTRANSTMVFDADTANIAPGFRFGFPTIEPGYYDTTTQKFAYLMVTPSGARVEFKQIGASNIYETADSSYTQLKTVGAVNPNDPVENITLTGTGTDGTQLSYGWKAGAYRCLQIKDANGNFITISHDEYGLLRTVTDTLGRVINVNYDGDNNPLSITQNWKDNNGAGAVQTHTYASFTYTDIIINPNFGTNITSIYGPQGLSEKVLQRITYTDGGSTRFDYNAYGQVYQVSNYAADNHELNHTRVNLSDSEILAGQSDCPRFSETRSFVENFNNGQETIITNTISENQTYNVGGNSGTATKIEVSLVGHPNLAVSKTFVGATGWKEGLPLATEDWADGTRQRWTWTNWTQDDTTKPYIVNPRVIETKVGDTTNTKRASVDYYLINEGSPVALYGLVKEVKVYDANQTTVLRQATTEYNLDNAYVSRRIIGLPSKTDLYGLNQANSLFELVSKVTYNYDEGNFGDATLEQTIAPVQHDTANFGASFIIGRGNLTSTTRWNVLYPTNSSEAVSSSVKYNTAGAVVAQISPWTQSTTRQVKISYADVFNDTPSNRNTFAYPTKLTDAAGNFSEVKYRFDTGTNVWAKSPAPQNQTSGKITERLFDAIGRLSKETLLNNGAYTRYEYPSNQIQAKIFTTIVDTNNNGADVNDEVLAESWTDGAGGVRQSRTELPNSTGGFSGSLVEYDILGRVKRSTVPTEINSSWQPAGDDLTRGWLWTSQEYDWKGRVTRTINPDGTDTLTSYDGCGCAGGQVTTIQGELVPVPNQSYSARRTQKVYADIQGRSYKTEVMNWNGATPYTTTVQTFNGRDQVVNTRQYAGAVGSSTFQDVTQSYDGHGRLKTRHYPIEVGETTWIYNADDSIQQVIDPRGAITNFTYNDPRGLVTQISYDAPVNPPPNITIPDTPNVNFAYDNLGNRTVMTDGTGTTSYTYDQLSRLTSETKQFAELPNPFTLLYEYSLSEAVKKIDILPNNTSVSYNYDKIGRANSVTGQGFIHSYTNSTITNIASNINYRAWNSVKSIDYGSSATLRIDYDNNLKVASFKIPTLMEIDYQYNADGRVKFANNLLDANFDRSYSYDHTERLSTAKTGEQANGGTEMTGPYNESVGFDAFDNMSSRNTIHWTRAYSFQSSYTNNRRNGWQYDASGNVIIFDGITNIFDAAETNTKITYPVQIIGDPMYDYSESRSEKLLTYDGDGQVVVEFSQTNEYRHFGSLTRLDMTSQNKEYNLKSTVLGGAIVYKYSTNYFWTINGPITTNGSANETNIFLHGKLLASMLWVSVNGPEYAYQFRWNHIDPMATTVGESVTGSVQGTTYFRAVLDPFGASVGIEDPYIEPDPPPPPPQVYFYGEFGSPEAIEMVEVDGILTPISLFPGLGSIVSQCPRSGCGPIRTENGWEYWTAFADGYEGYLPFGANYAGNGNWTRQTQDERKKKKPILGDRQGKKKPTNLRDVDPRTEETITPFDVGGIRSGIRIVWGNTDCKQIISDLLNAVADKSNPLVEGGDIEKLFELLLTQRRGGLTRTKVPGSSGHGSVSGLFRNNNASVFAPGDSEGYTSGNQLIADIGTVFNELLHLAGQNRRYTDRRFSEKIKANPVWANSTNRGTAPPYDQPQPYPLDIPGLTMEQTNLLLNDEGNAPWSSYFHSVVNNACFR